MGLKVIHRQVCQTQDFQLVKDWCERIIGCYGWNLTAEFNTTVDTKFAQIIKPVIVIYDTVDKPLEHIKLLLALRWG